MPIDKINHLAAVTGAVAYYLFGWVWYTVFFNQWLDLTHRTRADLNTSDPVPYIVSGLMAFVLSYGAAIALSHDDERTAMHGVQFGVFIGFVFLASTRLTESLAEGRPLALWVIDSAYTIVGLAIVGAIIGGWKKRVKPVVAAAAPPAPELGP
jgi:hypothetical protein